MMYSTIHTLGGQSGSPIIGLDSIPSYAGVHLELDPMKKVAYGVYFGGVDGL